MTSDSEDTGVPPTSAPAEVPKTTTEASAIADTTAAPSKAKDDIPRAWYSAGTNTDLWGDTGGTYTYVSPSKLPNMPPRGEGVEPFAWLRTAPPADCPIVPLRNTDSDAEGTLDRLIDEATALGLTVPGAWREFMISPEMAGKIPSPTACYFDLSSALLEPPPPLPQHSGAKLIRFLNDQQCCFLWYLYLLPDGSHQVVSACPEFKSPSEGTTLDDEVEKLHYVAVVAEGGLEEFAWRMWVEGRLWFDREEGGEAEKNYAEEARRKKDENR